jgi:formylglycine-generating enzyme required for sulfatase activity
MKKRVALDAAEKYTGRKYDAMTKEEWQHACKELNIDPFKGVFIDDEGSRRVANKKMKRNAGASGNMRLRTDTDSGKKRSKIV